MYDHIFVVIRNSLRIMMLNYKLKLPINSTMGYRDLFNPIVMTMLGTVISLTGIFKIWMKEKQKNLFGRYIKMNDFIKKMPRIE